MGTFPTSIDEVTTDWLTDSLRSTGDFEGAVAGFDAEPIGVGVGLMGLLYRIRLGYEGDAAGPATAVLKVPVPHEGTRHVARTFRFYEKEVGFYRDFADHTPFSTAACMAAHHDGATDDFALLLGDIVDGATYSQIDGCPPRVAEVAARALAHPPAAFADSPLFDRTECGWLPLGSDPPNPEGVIQGVADAWGPFQEIFPELIGPEIEEIMVRYPGSVRELLEEPTGRPLTLAHGDYRLDNLFFGRDGEVTVIDWQICARAVFAYDLAYFVTQSLTVADRQAHEASLIDAYLDELRVAGCDHDRDDFMADYRRTVMFCLCYPVQGGGQVDLANDRARALVVEMFERAMAAIRDHDATEFLTG